MELKVNKKDITNALKKIEIRGKWSSSSGLSSRSLGEYIQFQVEDNNLLLINADESTVAVQSISVDTENTGFFVLEIDTIKKYLTKMNDEITFEVTDTVVMKSDGKRATMPIVVEHPFEGRIERFINNWPITFDEELESITKLGIIDSACGIQLTGDIFYNTIDACEIVNNGIYKLDFKEEDDLTNAKFIISSEQTISSYKEEMEYLKVIGESSTVLFSGPLHKFFDKGDMINIFIGDDQPIIMVTENSAIVRAPRLGV